eukprot:705936_1
MAESQNEEREPEMRSEVWGFFKKLENRKKVQCNICEKVISFKSGATTPLRNHLSSIICRNKQKENNSLVPASVISRKRSSLTANINITPSTQPFKVSAVEENPPAFLRFPMLTSSPSSSTPSGSAFSQEDLEILQKRRAALAVAVASIPYKKLDDPLFIAAFGYPMTAREAPLQIDFLATEMMSKVVTTLSDKFLTMGLDGWTDGSDHRHFMNITLMDGRHGWLWKLLDTQWISQTAVFIKMLVSELILEIAANKIWIVGLQTDNASNMICGISLYCETAPYVIQLHCAAHVLQLLGKDLLRIDLFKEALSANDRIVAFLCKREQRARLGDLQPRRPALTRFNSHHESLKRTLQLREYMDTFCTVGHAEHVAPCVWEEIEMTMCVLEPIARCTKNCEADSATFFDVWKAEILLDTEMQSLKEKYPHATNAIEELLLRKNFRWEHLMPNEAITTAVVLGNFSDSNQQICVA